MAVTASTPSRGGREPMMITKMSMPRRTFLRGVGAVIALPWLDAMTPALTAATVAPQRPRFFYLPNGMYLPNFHPPGTAGAALQPTPRPSRPAPHRQPAPRLPAVRPPPR